ncbi:MAG: hypothetical protein J6U64_00200, partial [Alphaproteobacteria bacterium]|nr:hypothetical protein [Alphaproteobacteria bacterium]
HCQDAEHEVCCSSDEVEVYHNTADEWLCCPIGAPFAVALAGSDDLTRCCSDARMQAYPTAEKEGGYDCCNVGEIAYEKEDGTWGCCVGEVCGNICCESGSSAPECTSDADELCCPVDSIKYLKDGVPTCCTPTDQTCNGDNFVFNETTCHCDCPLTNNGCPGNWSVNPATCECTLCELECASNENLNTETCTCECKPEYFCNGVCCQTVEECLGNAESDCEENGGTVCNTACCLKGTVCRSEEDSLCCAVDSTLYYIDGVLACCGADKKKDCEEVKGGRFVSETCSCI